MIAVRHLPFVAVLLFAYWSPSAAYAGWAFSDDKTDVLIEDADSGLWFLAFRCEQGQILHADYSALSVGHDIDALPPDGTFRLEIAVKGKKPVSFPVVVDAADGSVYGVGDRDARVLWQFLNGGTAFVADLRTDNTVAWKAPFDLRGYSDLKDQLPKFCPAPTDVAAPATSPEVTVANPPAAAVATPPAPDATLSVSSGDSTKVNGRLRGETPEIEALLERAEAQYLQAIQASPPDQTVITGAYAIWEEAVKADSDVARQALATLYALDTVTDRTEQARALYQQLNDKGNAAGTFGLASILVDHDHNWRAANHLLLIAASKGNGDAMLKLSDYFDTNGPVPDPVRNLEWLTKSADAGNSYAQTKLANRYHNSGKDKIAWSYLTKAIDANEYTAWPLAGEFLQYGLGGAPHDIDGAIAAYHKGLSPTRGDVHLHLAEIYDDKSDPRRNDSSAAGDELFKAISDWNDLVEAAADTRFKKFSFVAIFELQTLLSKEGAYDGPLDGKLNEKAIKAIKAKYGA